MSTKNIEPLWWTLFSAGGVVAAFLVPIHVILFGFAVPLGWVADHGTLYSHWLVKLYLFLLISLPLYHWAHRFLFTLVDMGAKALHGLLAFLCYGAAIAGTLITAWVLLLI
jgi:fumarate reductase subunit D